MVYQSVSFFLLLIVMGCLSGFLNGFFGIGGGLIIVPMFYKILTVYDKVDDSMRMHIAVGTSLAIIIMTSLRSFIGHYHRKTVDMRLLRNWVTAVPVGSITASMLSVYVNAQILREIFSVVSFCIALFILLNNNRWRLGTELPKNPWTWILGVIIGVFSGLIGIGGAIFNNIFMVLYGRSIYQAIATSTGVSLLVSIPGALGYIYAGWGVSGLPVMSLGFINWGAALIVMPIAVLIAPVGIKVAYDIGKRKLEIGFSIFLFVISCWLFFFEG
ncbi:hypothetical protein B488_08240 [Liberibacter crescens BT-1]|uniref:Probable membrane transporter protein n=1 Tax=Liberibacter crescens (strain BT-1) TaxID=1215343 RepID=L0EWQ9_LIBCB|nr:sulfite exporter TauE/SafE family protein [Liberibacter crescens]AGA64816.1 hypothetical protein B488_08240 [Liberibacter crescens BT-1]AMC12874.1 membrane protein [Liberibacter crescens]